MTGRESWMPSADDLSSADLADQIDDNTMGSPRVDALLRRAGADLLDGLIAGHEGSHLVDRLKAERDRLRKAE